MATFRWLHLTDLHLGLKGQRWGLPGVKDHFFQDLKYMSEKCGPWDLVLFSGDLTQRGAPEQFAELDVLLASLWKHLGTLGSKPRLLAVPGNHDLERPDATWARQIIEAYGNGRDDKFWDGKDLHYRDGLRKAFFNYAAWWESTELKGTAPVHSGTLPGDFCTFIEKDGVRLGIVGLNTTFLQLVEGDLTRKLAVHPRQFHEACGGDGAAWTREHHACLLMTHQPPDWLTPESEGLYKSEIASPPRFATHLFGHMHESVIRTESYGGGQARRLWQGNSLFSAEPAKLPDGSDLERRHGYSIGELEIDGAEGRLRHWPRRLRQHPHGKHWEFIPDHESCSLSKVDNLGTNPEPVTLLKQAPKAARAAVEAEVKGHGIVKVTSTKDARLADYKACLLEAAGRCFISGTSAFHLAEDSADVLAHKLIEGVTTDILVMSPDFAQKNYHLFAWVAPKLQPEFHMEIRNSIEKLRAMWKRLPPEARLRCRLRTYATIFPLIVTGYEDGSTGCLVAEVTDLLRDPNRPRFTVRKKPLAESSVFSVFKEKFDSLWNDATLTKPVVLK